MGIIYQLEKVIWLRFEFQDLNDDLANIKFRPKFACSQAQSSSRKYAGVNDSDDALPLTFCSPSFTPFLPRHLLRAANELDRLEVLLIEISQHVDASTRLELRHRYEEECDELDRLREVVHHHLKVTVVHCTTKHNECNQMRNLFDQFNNCPETDIKQLRVGLGSSDVEAVTVLLQLNDSNRQLLARGILEKAGGISENSTEVSSNDALALQHIIHIKPDDIGRFLAELQRAAFNKSQEGSLKRISTSSITLEEWSTMRDVWDEGLMTFEHLLSTAWREDGLLYPEVQSIHGYSAMLSPKRRENQLQNYAISLKRAGQTNVRRLILTSLPIRPNCTPDGTALMDLCIQKCSLELSSRVIRLTWEQFYLQRIKHARCYDQLIGETIIRFIEQSGPFNVREAATKRQTLQLWLHLVQNQIEDYKVLEQNQTATHSIVPLPSHTTSLVDQFYCPFDVGTIQRNFAGEMIDFWQNLEQSLEKYDGKLEQRILSLSSLSPLVIKPTPRRSRSQSVRSQRKPTITRRSRSQANETRPDEHSTWLGFIQQDESIIPSLTIATDVEYTPHATLRPVIHPTTPTQGINQSDVTELREYWMQICQTVSKSIYEASDIRTFHKLQKCLTDLKLICFSQYEEQADASSTLHKIKSCLQSTVATSVALQNSVSDGKRSPDDDTMSHTVATGDSLAEMERTLLDIQESMLVISHSPGSSEKEAETQDIPKPMHNGLDQTEATRQSIRQLKSWRKSILPKGSMNRLSKIEESLKSVLRTLYSGEREASESVTLSHSPNDDNQSTTTANSTLNTISHLFDCIDRAIDWCSSSSNKVHDTLELRLRLDTAWSLFNTPVETLQAPEIVSFLSGTSESYRTGSFTCDLIEANNTSWNRLRSQVIRKNEDGDFAHCSFRTESLLLRCLFLMEATLSNVSSIVNGITDEDDLKKLTPLRNYLRMITGDLEVPVASPTGTLDELLSLMDQVEDAFEQILQESTPENGEDILEPMQCSIPKVIQLAYSQLNGTDTNSENRNEDTSKLSEIMHRLRCMLSQIRHGLLTSQSDTPRMTLNPQFELAASPLMESDHSSEFFNRSMIDVLQSHEDYLKLVDAYFNVSVLPLEQLSQRYAGQLIVSDGLMWHSINLDLMKELLSSHSGQRRSPSTSSHHEWIHYRRDELRRLNRVVIHHGLDWFGSMWDLQRRWSRLSKQIKSFNARIHVLSGRLPDYPTTLIPRLVDHIRIEDLTHSDRRIVHLTPPCKAVCQILTSSDTLESVESQRDWIRSVASQLWHLDSVASHLASKIDQLVEDCVHLSQQSSTTAVIPKPSTIFSSDWSRILSWIRDVLVELDWVLAIFHPAKDELTELDQWIDTLCLPVKYKKKAKTSLVSQLDQLRTCSIHVTGSQSDRLKRIHTRITNIIPEGYTNNNGLVVDRLIDQERRVWSAYQTIRSQLNEGWSKHNCKIQERSRSERISRQMTDNLIGWFHHEREKMTSHSFSIFETNHRSGELEECKNRWELFYRELESCIPLIQRLTEPSGTELNENDITLSREWPQWLQVAGDMREKLMTACESFEIMWTTLEKMELEFDELLNFLGTRQNTGVGMGFESNLQLDSSSGSSEYSSTWFASLQSRSNAIGQQLSVWLPGGKLSKLTSSTKLIGHAALILCSKRLNDRMDEFHVRLEEAHRGVRLTSRQESVSLYAATWSALESNESALNQSRGELDFLSCLTRSSLQSLCMQPENSRRGLWVLMKSISFIDASIADRLRLWHTQVKGSGTTRVSEDSLYTCYVNNGKRLLLLLEDVKSDSPKKLLLSRLAVYERMRQEVLLDGKKLQSDLRDQLIAFNASNRFIHLTKQTIQWTQTFCEGSIQADDQSVTTPPPSLFEPVQLATLQSILHHTLRQCESVTQPAKDSIRAGLIHCVVNPNLIHLGAVAHDLCFKCLQLELDKHARRTRFELACSSVKQLSEEELTDCHSLILAKAELLASIISLHPAESMTSLLLRLPLYTQSIETTRGNRLTIFDDNMNPNERCGDQMDGDLNTVVKKCINMHKIFKQLEDIHQRIELGSESGCGLFQTIDSILYLITAETQLKDYEKAIEEALGLIYHEIRSESLESLDTQLADIRTIQHTLRHLATQAQTSEVLQLPQLSIDRQLAPWRPDFDSPELNPNEVHCSLHPIIGQGFIEVDGSQCSHDKTMRKLIILGSMIHRITNDIDNWSSLDTKAIQCHSDQVSYIWDNLPSLKEEIRINNNHPKASRLHISQINTWFELIYRSAVLSSRLVQHAVVRHLDGVQMASKLQAMQLDSVSSSSGECSSESRRTGRIGPFLDLSSDLEPLSDEELLQFERTVNWNVMTLEDASGAWQTNRQLCMVHGMLQTASTWLTASELMKRWHSLRSSLQGIHCRSQHRQLFLSGMRQIQTMLPILRLKVAYDQSMDRLSPLIRKVQNDSLVDLKWDQAETTITTCQSALKLHTVCCLCLTGNASHRLMSSKQINGLQCLEVELYGYLSDKARQTDAITLGVDSELENMEEFKHLYEEASSLMTECEKLLAIPTVNHGEPLTIAQEFVDQLKSAIDRENTPSSAQEPLMKSLGEISLQATSSNCGDQEGKSLEKRYQLLEDRRSTIKDSMSDALQRGTKCLALLKHSHSWRAHITTITQSAKTDSPSAEKTESIQTLQDLSSELVALEYQCLDCIRTTETVAMSQSLENVKDQFQFIQQCARSLCSQLGVNSIQPYEENDGEANEADDGDLDTLEQLSSIVSSVTPTGDGPEILVNEKDEKKLGSKFITNQATPQDTQYNGITEFNHLEKGEATCSSTSFSASSGRQIDLSSFKLFNPVCWKLIYEPVDRTEDCVSKTLLIKSNINSEPLKYLEHSLDSKDKSFNLRSVLSRLFGDTAEHISTYSFMSHRKSRIASEHMDNFRRTHYFKFESTLRKCSLPSLVYLPPVDDSDFSPMEEDEVSPMDRFYATNNNGLTSEMSLNQDRISYLNPHLFIKPRRVRKRSCVHVDTPDSTLLYDSLTGDTNRDLSDETLDSNGEREMEEEEEEDSSGSTNSSTRQQSDPIGYTDYVLRSLKPPVSPRRSLQKTPEHSRRSRSSSRISLSHDQPNQELKHWLDRSNDSDWRPKPRKRNQSTSSDLTTIWTNTHDLGVSEDGCSVLPDRPRPVQRSRSRTIDFFDHYSENPMIPLELLDFTVKYYPPLSELSSVAEYDSVCGFIFELCEHFLSPVLDYRINGFDRAQVYFLLIPECHLISECLSTDCTLSSLLLVEQEVPDDVVQHIVGERNEELNSHRIMESDLQELEFVEEEVQLLGYDELGNDADDLPSSTIRMPLTQEFHVQNDLQVLQSVQGETEIGEHFDQSLEDDTYQQQTSDSISTRIRPCSTIDDDLLKHLHELCEKVDRKCIELRRLKMDEPEVLAASCDQLRTFFGQLEACHSRVQAAPRTLCLSEGFNTSSGSSLESVWMDLLSRSKSWLLSLRQAFVQSNGLQNLIKEFERHLRHTESRLRNELQPTCSINSDRTRGSTSNRENTIQPASTALRLLRVIQFRLVEWCSHVNLLLLSPERTEVLTVVPLLDRAIPSSNLSNRSMSEEAMRLDLSRLRESIGRLMDNTEHLLMEWSIRERRRQTGSNGPPIYSPSHHVGGSLDECVMAASPIQPCVSSYRTLGDDDSSMRLLRLQEAEALISSDTDDNIEESVSVTSRSSVSSVSGESEEMLNFEQATDTSWASGSTARSLAPSDNTSCQLTGTLSTVHSVPLPLNDPHALLLLQGHPPDAKTYCINTDLNAAAAAAALESIETLTFIQSEDEDPGTILSETLKESSESYTPISTPDKDFSEPLLNSLVHDNQISQTLPSTKLTCIYRLGQGIVRGTGRMIRKINNLLPFRDGSANPSQLTSNVHTLRGSGDEQDGCDPDSQFKYKSTLSHVFSWLYRHVHSIVFRRLPRILLRSIVSLLFIISFVWAFSRFITPPTNVNKLDSCTYRWISWLGEPSDVGTGTTLTKSWPVEAPPV